MRIRAGLRCIRVRSAIGLTLVLAACSQGDPVATSTISIQDNLFEPRVAQVAPGTTTFHGGMAARVVVTD
jgi:hypothetical protein